MNEVTTSPPRLPEVGMDAITRAEIDLQIQTAKAFPRQISIVSNNVLSLVTMDREFAESCMFALPRGGKPIVGPSIRLAEVLFSQWGNCTGGARTVNIDRKGGFVEAEGVFHDLETNAKSVRRVQRRITSKNGSLFSDDMILVTANAAGSIAFRNAVLSGVPRAVWDKAYKEAQTLVKGDSKTLEERKSDVLKVMAAFGFTEDELCAVLGIPAWADVMLEQIITLRGLYNSLKDGETSRETILAEVDSEVVESAKAKRKAPVKKATAAPKPHTKAEPEKSDPIVQSEPQPEEPAEKEPAKTGSDMNAESDRRKAIGYTIIAEARDVGAEYLDEVLDVYKETLVILESEAPEVHDKIMDEIEAIRSAPAN